MKGYCNDKCWNIILDIVYGITDVAQMEDKLDDKVIKERCSSLAYYYTEVESDTHKKTMEELKKAEMEGEIFSSYFLVKVARHLYLEELVEGRDTTAARLVVSTLHAYLGNCYYFSLKADVIKQLYLYGMQFVKKYDMIKADKVVRRIAQSANYLKSKGFYIHVKNGDIDFTEQLEQELFHLLDKKIARLGGMYLYVEVIKRFVDGNYIEMFDRYLLMRKIGEDRNEPVNLLINLSARHIQNRNLNLTDKQRKDMTDEIIKVAESMLDISAIQGESAFEYTNMDVIDFPYYLKNEMVFDKMCIPIQYSKQYILKSMDHLIKPWFDEAGRDYTYKDYRTVAEYILSMKCFNGFVNQQQIKKDTRIAKYKISQILEDVSIQLISVNKEYTSLDAPTNLFSRPLIAFPMNRYYLIDQHFSGIGFYLAAYDMIKARYSVLDKKQGLEVEKFLLEEMTRKGYKCLSGKYNNKKGLKGRDCDLIFKKSVLHFFEIKKRSIMKEFNSVDDVGVLNSLARGMVRAQIQAFSHELYLQKNGQLNLDDGRYVIDKDETSLPARKISVCFSEYSYLTNKTFSMKLMELLLLCNISTVDKSRQMELDFLNQYGEELRDIVEQLYEGRKCISREVVFPSIFCSLQQILTAVWCCDTEEQFLEIVREWIYRTDKTLDPYLCMLTTRYWQMHPEENNVSKLMVEMIEKKMPNCMIVGGM